VATAILDRAVDELLLAARSVATTLEMHDDAIRFVLAGGAFRVVPWLADELGRRLPTIAARSDVQVLGREPAMGAVQLAIAGARGGTTLPHYRAE
jgi:N-acetylglucosamine kinase-like BadF-type ATPase